MKEIIRELIMKGETADALNLLIEYSKESDESLRNEVILLSSRYHRNKFSNQSHESIYREDTQINAGILHVLGQISEDKSSYWFQRLINKLSKMIFGELDEGMRKINEDFGLDIDEGIEKEANLILEKQLPTIKLRYDKIKNPFIKVGRMEDWRIIVVKNGKEGMIDFYGKEISPPIYDEIERYLPRKSEVLIVVKLNQKYGYLNRITGKIVIQPKYEMANLFVNGRAEVIEGGVSFKINEDGKRIT